jgi:histidinol-phosphatase (PHP family)
MPVETACETAISNGLEGITFTDHLDYDYPGYDDDFFHIDFKKYSDSMDKTRSEYASRLNVLKGIEIGIQPHVIDKTVKVVESYNFDYVLASVHIMDGLDPYRESFYETRQKHEAYARYLSEILFMVKNISNFDNIGHPEYIIRYATYNVRMLLYADHSDLFDEIFKMLISGGKGMEVNTGSYKTFPNRVTPAYDINVLKRYRELGGEIVTLASDAHFPQYIGYKFKEFRALLLEAGFQYSVHFENRKPVFDRL